MLFVLFTLDKDRYALESGCIVEVLPLVDVKQLPRAAPGIAGIFDYRGAPIPAIDLSALALGRPAMRRLSTRIVVANYEDDGGATHLLGLIAEGATETMRRERADFAAFGLASGSAPYLGPVSRGPRGLIQWIDVKRLLSESIRESLLQPLEALVG